MKNVLQHKKLNLKNCVSLLSSLFYFSAKLLFQQIILFHFFNFKNTKIDVYEDVFFPDFAVYQATVLSAKRREIKDTAEIFYSPFC